MKRYSTGYLLSVAAIAAASAIVLVAGNWLAYATIAVPLLNAVVIGVWTLPFAAAMRLLPLPGTALLVGLFSGILMGPFQPDGFRAVFVNLWYAFFFELVFAVVLYRVRATWFFLLAGAVNGAVWGVSYAISVDAGSFPLWVQIGLPVVGALASAAWARLGVVVADALAARGVGAGTRRAIARAEEAARAEKAAKAAGADAGSPAAPADAAGSGSGE